MLACAKNGISKPKALLNTYSSAALHIPPKNHKQAMEDVERYDPMKREFSIIKQKDTWDLVPASLDKKVIGSQWVFKVETKADGTIDKLKARLIVCGFEQLT